MSKHAPIKLGYDLPLWEEHHVKQPLYVAFDKNLHWQICGNSGSGKSYFTLYALRNVLMEYRADIKLWFMDFKSSEDWAFLSGHSRYYVGEHCADGLEEFYREYQLVKDGKITDGRIRLMVFDEWAGFQTWATQQNKKLAEKYRSYLLEVLLMGRSMRCGVWVIMQRNDAKFIEGREQFFVTVVFGKMSRELKLMVMQGEDLEQREIYDRGEGIVRMDSIGTKFLKVPKLKDVENVKRQILSCLAQAEAAHGGDGEA